MSASVLGGRVDRLVWMPSRVPSTIRTAPGRVLRRRDHSTVVRPHAWTNKVAHLTTALLDAWQHYDQARRDTTMSTSTTRSSRAHRTSALTPEIRAALNPTRWHSANMRSARVLRNRRAPRRSGKIRRANSLAESFFRPTRPKFETRPVRSAGPGQGTLDSVYRIGTVRERLPIGVMRPAVCRRYQSVTASPNASPASPSG